MSAPSAPTEVESLNFEEIGVRWTVRSQRGDRRRFSSLRSLREALADGSVRPGDELSFDGAIWRPVRDIPDLRAYFWEVFKGVKQGRIHPTASGVIGVEDDLIEDDAPTTLVRPDHFLQTAIQESLARELAARVEEKNLPPSLPTPEPEPSPTPTPPTQPTSHRTILVVVLGVVALLVLLATLAVILLGGIFFIRV